MNATDRLIALSRHVIGFRSAAGKPCCEAILRAIVEQLAKKLEANETEKQVALCLLLRYVDHFEPEGKSLRAEPADGSKSSCTTF